MIKDSGNRTEFKSGAVRDIQEGKGRCDLLPLIEVGEWVEPEHPLNIFTMVNEYRKSPSVNKMRLILDTFAIELSAADKDITDLEDLKKYRYDLILEVSKHFEEGAKKYGDRNWEKGIPCDRYIDSAIRHYLKWRAGWTDEPHDRAFMWNILCCEWTRMEYGWNLEDLENKSESESKKFVEIGKSMKKGVLDGVGFNDFEYKEGLNLEQIANSKKTTELEFTEREWEDIRNGAIIKEQTPQENDKWKKAFNSSLLGMKVDLLRYDWTQEEKAYAANHDIKMTEDNHALRIVCGNKLVGLVHFLNHACDRKYFDKNVKDIWYKLDHTDTSAEGILHTMHLLEQGLIDVGYVKGVDFSIKIEEPITKLIYDGDKLRIMRKDKLIAVIAFIDGYINIDREDFIVLCYRLWNTIKDEEDAVNAAKSLEKGLEEIGYMSDRDFYVEIFG